MIKQCKFCGKEFEAYGPRVYCSTTCGYEGRKVDSARRKKKTKKEKPVSIEEIQRRARAEGLSYGQYMAKISINN